MPITNVTQTGNVFIPKEWRDLLGIDTNSSVFIEKANDKIIIEPLKKRELKEAFKSIDEEMKRRRIHFTKGEAIKDDLYD